VTDSMVLLVAFQTWYIIDALWFEEAFLTTMDVAYDPLLPFCCIGLKLILCRTDGSGFMLDMGTLLWVPMVFSFQSRFLASHPVVLGPLGISGVIAIQLLGYFIFRSSNLQKDRFKADDPSVQGNSLLSS